MKIDIDNGQYFYELFYQVSFLLVLFIYLIEGYKRRFPWSTWLLVIITVRIFFIIGSKFGAITPDDFNYFTQHFQFPAQHNINLMGALVFGFIGVGVAKWLLKIKYPILDAFAIAAPFGMAVQRIGCLLVGCCYGTETQMPWGIHYGINTPAFFHNFLSHQIPANETLTQALHPVPIYFVISSLVIGIALIFLRKTFKRPGNLALFSLALILISRFFIEFFRDPLSNGAFQGNMFLGLKVVQLFILVASVALAGIILFREKHQSRKSFTILPNHPLLNASYLLMLAVLLFVTRNWFSTIEFQVLLITLIPAVLFVTNDLITSYFTSLIRISTISLLMLSLLVMSQTNPTTKTTSYEEFRVGFSSGQYANTHDIGMGTGCNRESISQDFKQQYKLGAVGYSVFKKDSFKTVEYGVNGYYGRQTELGLKTGFQQTNSLWGINPYARIDKKWIGAGIGIHVGDLKLTPGYWTENKTEVLPATGTMSTFIYPHLYARFGIERILYISYHWGDYFPAPFPALNNYFEFGSGFGSRKGFRASVGVNDLGFAIVKTKIPINNTFIIEPMYQLGSSNPINNIKSYQFSLGLHYLFGYRSN
ncbi:MAG: prolipoprotein diacylglyceryl transferase [Paludibacter sp.]|nr:prolipoprotein diacylglyceryl transferase [Paludibacter sp.]